MRHITTFTDFLLESEKTYPLATGSFTLLLVQIENAAKLIASHIKEAGLADIIGKTGKKNSFEEEVQKLDILAHTTLVNFLTSSGQTHAIISEEHPEPILTPSSHQGDYIVYMDPLDGSSNIDINAPVGTIFSLYHAKGGILQKGSAQVAAGYILYGSSVMLVFTNGKEVNGFTLDPSMGSFLLSHPHVEMPKYGSVYSLNEGYSPLYDSKYQAYLAAVKEQHMSLRYIGALVADFHRTLLKGGIFLYPTDTHHPTGKLRLMIEANPMALLTKAAGGMALSGITETLEVLPQHIHDTVPFVVGSIENVREYRKAIALH